LVIAGSLGSVAWYSGQILLSIATTTQAGLPHHQGTNLSLTLPNNQLAGTSRFVILA
jgi:hypothetical protein